MNDLEVEMVGMLLHSPVHRDLLATDALLEQWGHLGDDVFCHPYGYLMPSAFGVVVCPPVVHHVWAAANRPVDDMAEYATGIRILLEEMSVTIGSFQERYVAGVEALRRIAPGLWKIVMEVQATHG